MRTTADAGPRSSPPSPRRRARLARRLAHPASTAGAAGVVRQAQAIAWSRRLLHLLLDELHISDDFDRLVGSTRRLTPADYPPVIAIALVLRHSRCPQDFARRCGVSASPA